MGDKIGRIHLGKQDLGSLQTRKMKGLKGSKRSRDTDTEGEVGGNNSISVSGGDQEEERPGAQIKRPKLTY